MQPTLLIHCLISVNPSMSCSKSTFFCKKKKEEIVNAIFYIKINIHAELKNSWVNVQIETAVRNATVVLRMYTEGFCILIGFSHLGSIISCSYHLV